MTTPCTCDNCGARIEIEDNNTCSLSTEPLIINDEHEIEHTLCNSCSHQGHLPDSSDY